MNALTATATANVISGGQQVLSLSSKPCRATTGLTGNSLITQFDCMHAVLEAVGCLLSHLLTPYAYDNAHAYVGSHHQESECTHLGCFQQLLSKIRNSGASPEACPVLGIHQNLIKGLLQAMLQACYVVCLLPLLILTAAVVPTA